MSAEPTTNGRRPSVANIVSLITMGVLLAGVWVSLAADNARTTQRVVTLEKQRDADRADAKSERQEIKNDVREIGSNVQLILQKLEGMEAERRADRRARTLR